MKKTGILITLMVLAAVPAAAQDRAGTFEISPFAGGNFGGSLYSYTGPSTPYVKLDVGDSAAYGARFAYNFSRWAGIEFGWSHSSSGLYTGPGGAFAPQTRVGTFDNDAFEANGVFSFTRGQVVPYFTVGGGVNSMKLTQNAVGSSSDTRFVANMGIGVNFWVNPHFGIRIEGKVRSTNVGNNGSSCGNHNYCDNNYYYDSSWYTSGEATGGLSFAF